jgi:signal peptidase II
VHLLPGLTFVRAQNSGISFRLLAHQPDLVIAAVICVIIAVSAYALPRLHTRGFSLAYGLLLGGALSNLFDHVRAHMVSDFIQLPLNFPIFNLADVFVVAGAMIFGWLIMKKALEKDEAVRLANSLP